MVAVGGLCFAVSWWDPWPQARRECSGGERRELSCHQGNGQQEREMWHCLELCRANGEGENGCKKSNEGDGREAGGEADVACAEGTAFAAGKVHVV